MQIADTAMPIHPAFPLSIHPIPNLLPKGFHTGPLPAEITRVTPICSSTLAQPQHLLQFNKQQQAIHTTNRSTKPRLKQKKDKKKKETFPEPVYFFLLSPTLHPSLPTSTPPPPSTHPPSTLPAISPSHHLDGAVNGQNVPAPLCSTARSSPRPALQQRVQSFTPFPFGPC